MTTIHIDLDDALLRRADAVLSEQGLSIPEAVGQWLVSIADREFLPMEPRQPNKQPNWTTIEAMRECDEDLPSFASTNELIAYLHEAR